MPPAPPAPAAIVPALAKDPVEMVTPAPPAPAGSAGPASATSIYPGLADPASAPRAANAALSGLYPWLFKDPPSVTPKAPRAALAAGGVDPACRRAYRSRRPATAGDRRLVGQERSLAERGPQMAANGLNPARVNHRRAPLHRQTCAADEGTGCNGQVAAGGMKSVAIGVGPADGLDGHFAAPVVEFGLYHGHDV